MKTTKPKKYFSIFSVLLVLIMAGALAYFVIAGKSDSDNGDDQESNSAQQTTDIQSSPTKAPEDYESIAKKILAELDDEDITASASLTEVDTLEVIGYQKDGERFLGPGLDNWSIEFEVGNGMKSLINSKIEDTFLSSGFMKLPVYNDDDYGYLGEYEFCRVGQYEGQLALSCSDNASLAKAFNESASIFASLDEDSRYFESGESVRYAGFLPDAPVTKKGDWEHKNGSDSAYIFREGQITTPGVGSAYLSVYRKTGSEQWQFGFAAQAVQTCQNLADSPGSSNEGFFEAYVDIDCYPEGASGADEGEAITLGKYRASQQTQ